jgi:hypothetical protein
MRGHLITNVALWLIFTVAALFFGLFSLSSFSDKLTFGAYLATINANWHGEYFYFFGSTALQSIVFGLHFGLVLRWADLRRRAEATQAYKPTKDRPALYSDRVLHRVIAAMPILAFLNALALFDNMVLIRQIGLQFN